jgi:hypothetical protein
VRDEMAARDRMDVDGEEAMDDDDDDEELDPEGQSPLCLPRCRRLTSGHDRASAAPGLCAEAQPGVWLGCLCALQTLLTPLTALWQRSRGVSHSVSTLSALGQSDACPASMKVAAALASRDEEDEDSDDDDDDVGAGPNGQV